MNKIALSEKRKVILKQKGHVLVTGGPGSGKTTIALLKAAEVSQSLTPGQEILFLSFSRAAIQQVLQKSHELLGRAERSLIRVQTYHAFCIELLTSHGRLLSGRPCKFVVPGEERLRKSVFNGQWDAERERIAKQDNVFCFDLLAASAAELLEKSTAVRTLLTSKFPLVICDEFQDTDDDQWRIVQTLAVSANLCFLADPEQRIFDYRASVNPLRVQQLREKLDPMEFGLGSENHRSPNGGILEFADCVLQKTTPTAGTKDVKFATYYGKDFDAIFHAATAWTFAEVRKRGVESPSIAVLCRTNGFLASLSDMLQSQHTLNGNPIRPIEHGLVWDAELALAAAVIVASIMEWSAVDPSTLAQTLGLLARYYHLKNAERATKTAAASALRYSQMAEAIRTNQIIRSKPLQRFVQAFTNGVNFAGDPIKDWLVARSILKSVDHLDDVFSDASMVRLFGAREMMVAGLADLWLSQGSYGGATRRVADVLDQQRLLEAERIPRGCLLMTIHKSKGKEFDGVVLVEGAHRSPFFDTAREDPPYEKSRRLIRVGVTRARHFVFVVRPHGATPLTG